MSYNSNLTRLNTLRKTFVHAWTCNLICVLLTLKSQMQNVFSFNTSVSYQSSTIQGIKFFSICLERNIRFKYLDPAMKTVSS